VSGTVVEQAAWGALGAASVACYVWFLARAETIGSPAALVRRMARSGRPVTVKVGAGAPWAWDPTRKVGFGGFYAPGTVTYTLTDNGKTIRVRYAPKSGHAVERSCPVPPDLMPDEKAARRRRIARAIVTLYAAFGAAAFAVTVEWAGGSDNARIRIGAIVALGIVSVSWLLTHLVLTLRGHHRTGHSGHPSHAHLRRLLMWAISYLLITAALAVAWRFGNADQAQAMSWGTAFVSAAVFVLAVAAALAASLHHHTYIHHTPPPSGTGC
jgi:hypothetical protein